MKKDKNDELRPEYRREGLGLGIRGKYLDTYREGTNLVLLSPDVAKVFPTQQSVNDALCSLIDVAQRSVGPIKRPTDARKAARLSVNVRRHLGTSARIATLLSACLCSALLAACASTTVTLTPSPQAPVCDRGATALVLWAPQWRPDQKDVAAREEAAASGLSSFFAGSGCFARTELRRTSSLSPATVASELGASDGQFNSIVTIAVRELGPVVKLLSSASLVEGGTEVVLQVTWRALQSTAQAREFTVHWRHGGPGVVKGVASLPRDMNAALRSGLQPGPATQ